ncbi:ATP-binding protein [Streptomyces acidiscabies]|uniref:ATP-binding protein n=1 Tax=Streptomyces acidiscabies TaxID=42234 RepID=A0AAP6BI19_9ACTN|nr:ATP-binding protein [Streptomyces acidiscabies]MDX2965101.1 ATP-binding protein [Streptomyces acidiscabies]MDX3022530.1 ATP-binding protein [Streptomyces acidiscabies]MDX3796124.1 ATP-binding protein [Streptomyces acidiscabies]GAQ55995.1 histidine kinase-, DNA gyrase B-, and HSP90-like ATPase [Streptomyces acidiscabies]GAV44817.1 histidine kinase-, DNA gyrase B-, and HSP90-like ATPase [Streptomyces acidiscabies]
MNSTTRPARTGIRTHGKNFPRVPESARAARRFVATALNRLALSGLCDAVTLIVSELVANAVCHAEGDSIRVTVSLVGGRRVRVAVSDGSRCLPRLGSPAPEDDQGRGLPIVEELSDRLGVDRLSDGKRVWAELALGLEDR